VLSATLILVLLLSTAAWSQGDTPQNAASVNGEAIAYKDVVQASLARVGEQVLDGMIIARVIEQAAAKAGLTVNKDELDARCVAAERQVELKAPVTGINFATWLQMNQMTADFFRQSIYLTILLEKMVAPNVNVTHQMVVDYYTRNREKLRQPDKVKIAHICVSDKAKAEELRSQIVDGKIAFEQAAKENSLDPWTKDIGGEFGYIVPGEDPFQQAAFALTRDGEISPVIQTKMGYHILKRLEFQPSGIPPFEDVADSIQRALERDRVAHLVTDKKRELMDKAKIERYVTFGPPAPAEPAAGQ